MGYLEQILNYPKKWIVSTLTRLTIKKFGCVLFIWIYSS